MEILIIIINVYFGVTLFVLVLNAIISGYQGKEVGIDDVIQSAFWPVLLAQLLGILFRIYIDNYKDKQSKHKIPKKESK